MRHHKSIRKFGRKTDQRKALLRSLALALVTNDKIKTTEAKAKELRPFVEKLVTRSKSNTLANRRFLITQLGSKGTTRLMKDISPKFMEKNGGYTRITRLPRRVSDASKMAQIEFV